MILQNPFAKAVHHRHGLPILPGAFPLLGHIPTIYRHGGVVFRRARAEIGPAFWIRIPGTWMLSVSGREGMELIKDKRLTNRHLQKTSPLITGQSLLSQEGDIHRRMRSVLISPFTPRGLSTAELGGMTAQVVTNRVESWFRAKKITVLHETQALTLEVIFRAIGIEPENISLWGAQYRELVLANLGIPIMLPGFPEYRAARAQRWINERLLELVKTARRGAKRNDIVHTLVHTKDEEGQPLTDTELVDNLRLLIFGGHDTTATAMAWLVIVLASQPALLDTLCEEARQATTVPTSPQEARQYPFAEALFREVVRVYPPFGMVVRVTEEPVEIGGKTVPVGTMVAIDLWNIARDRSVFEAPDDFRPSRWLGRSSPPTPIEISQFGSGPHFCLGYHLAWLEMVQFAVVLAQEVTRSGRRPRLMTQQLPAAQFLPIAHPPANTTIEL